MFNNVLKKFQNTLNESIKNVKMIVNTLNETRPIINIHDKQYYLDNLIAEGGYALIYKIQSVSDEKLLALKKINIQSSSHKKQIKREIKIWKELSKFGNIVELIDFEFTEKNVFVVMELCEEGTLLDFVNNHEGNISEVEALLIFNQILLGVNALHSQKPPIAHRDLKIENILKKKKTYKLCDFGSASDEVFDPTTSDEFIKEQNFSDFEKYSTLYYRAPEMCDRYTEYIVSEKVDIWSLGCILYTMVFKEQPFFNAQKLEIINGNYNFPQDEQKLYSEKFLDLIRVMLTPNPNKRPNLMQIMEWTNYWNETQKIPLSPEVEEIKKKQIKSGGIKNTSHKKKLLSVEEIEKIQSKLKSKEDKKKKNYDDINELFGFSKGTEEEVKEENKKTNLNDDLFAVFNGAGQNQENKKENQNDNLLDMEFYEVDQTKEVNTKVNNNQNINNDLDAIFGTSNNINNYKKEENKNNTNNFDLLFSSGNENQKEIKKETNNMKKTDLNDLLNAINNKNINENSNNKDLFYINNNPNTNNITFKMNGQDLFSNFQPSNPKKENSQKPKEEDDLFASFNKRQNKDDKKKEEKNTKLEDDLFAAFSQPQSNPIDEKKETKKEEESNKSKVEDLFSAFNEFQNKPKEEERKKKEIKIPNIEEDLFSSFNQPQSLTKPKEEKKDNNNNKNIEDDLFSAFTTKTTNKEEDKKEDKPMKKESDDFFATFNQPKVEKKEEGIKKNTGEDLFAAFALPQSKPKEEKKNVKVEEDFFSGFGNPQEKQKEKKKDIKNIVEFDLFNFGNSELKQNEDNKNENKKDNNMDLLFSLGNNTENGGESQTENGQSQHKSSIDNIQGSTNSNTENKNQDIFAFFQ